MSWEDQSADPDLLFRVRPADAAITSAIDAAREAGLPEPSLEIGRMLEILAGGAGVGRILEVGRGVGLSTLCLARGAGRAVVLSIDQSTALEAASRLLKESGVDDRVELVTEEPLAAVERLDEHFDRVHLSVGIAEALRLIDRVLPRLSVGGLLTVEGLQPRDSAAVDRARAVAGYLIMHPQLDAQILAIGEGLGVARKKQPLVTEMGGPF